MYEQIGILHEQKNLNTQAFTYNFKNKLSQELLLINMVISSYLKNHF
jgi:hypothetical protein